MKVSMTKLGLGPWGPMHPTAGEGGRICAICVPQTGAMWPRACKSISAPWLNNYYS
jgi:hypothetical protein